MLLELIYFKIYINLPIFKFKITPKNYSKIKKFESKFDQRSMLTIDQFGDRLVRVDSNRILNQPT